MDIIKFIKATVDYFKYQSENPSGYTQQKDFIELVQNNNSVLEMLIEELWQPGKAVTVGQVIWSPNMAKNQIAIVTSAGTTDDTEPTWGASTTKETNVTYAMRERVKISSMALETFRPVGSYYFSFSDTSPTVLFGGTWERLADGRTFLSAGTNYVAGTVGGEFSHTLTASELPSHSHGGTIGGGSHSHTASCSNNGAHTHAVYGYNTSGSGNTYHCCSYQKYSNTVPSAGAHSHTITVATSASHSHTFTGANVGGGQAHNNMQPYVAVYCWKRTA